jgi:hypothetical protein
MKKYKYRIYENFDGFTKEYYVKRKRLWWYTEDFDDDNLKIYGCLGGVYRKYFKSVYDAEKAINRSGTVYSNKYIKDYP